MSHKTIEKTIYIDPKYTANLLSSIADLTEIKIHYNSVNGSDRHLPLKLTIPVFEPTELKKINEAGIDITEEQLEIIKGIL